MKLETIVRIDWDESEAGWGIRPDGCSLHLNRGDSETFVKEYWATMPKEVPTEYSRPSGPAYVSGVSQAMYTKVKKSKNGVRLWNFDTHKLDALLAKVKK